MPNKFNIIILFLLNFFVFSLSVKAQKQQYQVACIGFYNLENLFDTEDSPDTDDAEFTPQGANKWTDALYADKLKNMAQVLAVMGTDVTPDGPAILGVCEIENRRVLEDLSAQPSIRDRNYKVVQFNSPDRRGVDVGFMYQPKYFTPTESRPLHVWGPDAAKGDTLFTRDVLYVKGLLVGEPIHVFVNHWPSRRGGEERSSPLREFAAGVARAVIDSILLKEPNAKIFVMGDLNDFPINKSVRKVMMAVEKPNKVKSKEFFNPWYAPYKKGVGTTAYQDSWGLFDMILLSKGTLNKADTGFHYHKSRIVNDAFLIQKTDRYKGYPFRTFSNGNYQGGYSDHFPVVIYLIKKI